MRCFSSAISRLAGCRHAEGRAGLVVAHSGADEDDEVLVLGAGEAAIQLVVADLDLGQIAAGSDDAAVTAHVPTTRPPSTEITVPLTYEAASEASQR